MEGCPEGGNAVLTRRMAKKQHCPLMPTAKIYEHHVNGVQINCEVIEYEKCTGEECPKWQDGKTDGKVCPYGGTEKWTGEGVPIMGIVGKQYATVLPAPTATATVEADHARL